MEELAAPSSSSSSNSTNTCPWLWIIEYLASFPEIDPSLLHDVIEAAPEIPEGEGKTTREMVSLKCLQELFACDYLSSTNHNVTRGGPPPLPLRLDLSLSCEDVLQSLLRLTLVSDLKRGGTEFLEWDIRAFIQRKRASMPKCTLEQLKDGTLEVACAHPYATSLKETGQKNDKGDTEPAYHDTEPGVWNSPLLRTDGKGNDSPRIVVIEGNSIPVLLANENGIVEDPSHNGNSVLIKRDRSCLVDNELDSADAIDDINMNAKRLKQDLPSIGSSMERDSVSPSTKQFVNEIPERMVGDIGDNGPSVEKECQLGGLGFKDSVSLERGHENSHVAKQPGRSPDADANDEFQQNQNTEHHNSNIMLQDTPKNGCHQYILLNECGDTEPRVSTDVPFVRNKPTVSVNGTKDLNDCALNPAASNTFHGNTRMDEAEGSMEHLSTEDTSTDNDEYPHERVDVAMEKDHFLSSQCALGDEYLATANWTEQNLCMKCNKDGQVLVCSAVGCPLVVHESCLGSSAKYKKGKFYCPFCAYSLAISEFLEAKKRASLARKKLTAFIHVESLSENCNERLSSKKHSNSRRSREEDPLLNIYENGNLEGAVEGHACTRNDHQSTEREGDHQEVVPPGSCPDACLVRRGKQNPTATTFDTSAEEKEGEEMIQECPSAKELDTPEVQVHTDPNSSHTAPREHNRVVSVKKRQAEEETCGEVSEQQVADSSGRPGCATKIDHVETSEDVDNNSGYSMRSRSRNKQYTHPAMPQLRRKRVPWTAEEEEILKEGVQKFSSDSEKNMPWRKILEYGSSVFWNGRTPIDLKDKWRNMCRGKP